MLNICYVWDVQCWGTLKCRQLNGKLIKDDGSSTWPCSRALSGVQSDKKDVGRGWNKGCWTDFKKWSKLEAYWRSLTHAVLNTYFTDTLRLNELSTIILLSKAFYLTVWTVSNNLPDVYVGHLEVRHYGSSFWSPLHRLCLQMTFKIYSDANVQMYADDTVIYIYASNVAQVANKLASSKVHVTPWLEQNCLHLNVPKTVRVHFSKSNQTIVEQTFSGEKLVKECKCLELYLSLNSP